MKGATRENESMKGKVMYIRLVYSYESEVDNAIRVAKENNLAVEWVRDGEHGTDDLAVILKFQDAGFEHKIMSYQGRFEDNAIKVVFRPKEKARTGG